ncbi:hypothetical protein OZX61_10320 [Acinetobacter sp. ESL0695]|uniref:hypothetical protein n=1 Tax=Acinetobacter sp. ESL0695 TaxID=2983215 RepID=UPI0023F3975A|nr:hypothetical protein [Acinetobacter sp. ESL0695]WEV48640.1 hypothetical protein OZX61_10320 [Acinetobacter sp. ESL0695]
MLLSIISAVVILLIIAVVIIKKRNAEAPKTQPKKPSDLKTTTENQAEQKSSAASEQPKADESLYSQIHTLIEQENYSAAEALINQSLNKNPKQSKLYLVLLDIYQKQDDELAIKQLINQLRSSELFESLKEVKEKNNAYKEAKRQEEEAKKPTSQEEVKKDVFSKETQFTNQISHEELLGQAVSQPKPPVSEQPKKQETSAPKETVKVEPQPEQSTTKKESIPQKEKASEDLMPLDFTFSKKSEDQKEAPKPDTTPEPEKKAEPKVEEAPTLNFDTKVPEEPKVELEQPAEKSTKATEDSSSDTPELAPLNLDFGNTSSTKIDENDVLVKNFSELKTLNENALNIDLAEQYIAFGEKERAKELLTDPKQDYSAEEKLKVDKLLNSIAS